MLAAPSPKQIVFVDCENIPSFDLTVIADKPVQVRLVVGKQQKQVGIEILRAALQFQSQVQLIEAGVSGHNALDIILAAHLGRAWALEPNAEFVIVSKDKDFDSLVTHLRGLGVPVRRDPSFLVPRKSVPARPSRSSVVPPSGVKPEKPAVKDMPNDSVPIRADRFNELVHFIKEEGSPLPRKKAALLRLIGNRFGNQLSPDEQQTILDRLERRKLITVTESGAIAYPHLNAV